MKKIFSTLFILFAFYTISFAQRRYQESTKVEFGIDAGVNGSYLTSNDYYGTTDAVAGFNVAVSADVYFSDSWSLKIKGIYDQKGWGNGYIIDNNNNEIDGVDFKLNYVTIPVMANWHFGYTRNWYLNFGM